METIGKETDLLCLRGHSPDEQWLGVVSGIAMKQNGEAEEHGSSIAPLLKTELHASPLQTPSPAPRHTLTTWCLSDHSRIKLARVTSITLSLLSALNTSTRVVIDLQMKKTVRI